MSHKLTENVADAWRQVRQSIDQVHQKEIAEASDSCTRMLGSVADLQSRLTGAGESVAELSKVQQHLAELNQQLLSNLQTMAGDGALKETLQGLERQLARNSEVLESLGERVGVAAAGRGKRWWPFAKKAGETHQDG